MSALANPGRSALERTTRTARQLAEASLSPNTRRAYSGALRRLDAWLDGRPLEDATLAAYLAELRDQGRAPASAATAVTAACFRARLAGGPTPAGERTARVLAGYRRTAGDRDPGQARPFGAADLAAILATCHPARRRGRESEEVALERGRLDAVIAIAADDDGVRPTRTARQLAEASLSPNTRRAYTGALRRLDAWLDGRPLEDATLATYLAELHDQGRAPASAATAVAAACFRARLAGGPTPAGERTARVLAGYRRTAGDRGRGQARPFGAADLAAVLATCHQPRGRETEEVALERGRLDAVIAGLLFMGGMRRSEVSALRWADVAIAADVDGVLVTVRHRTTNQEDETKDVRFVKGSVARAIRMLGVFANPAPEDRVVPLSPKMVGLRFQAAARAAGVEHVTAHSGRVGLASELTSRGASTTDVMLAGNWKTSRMVAHYSAGATAERGAVARYL